MTYSNSTLLILTILVSFLPGLISSAVVTLESIEIYTTHEWLKSKPNVYFQCKGENRTALLDVKDKHVLYNFKGQESWQPLTEFSSTKCKRCGFYEKDTLKPDDVFDEWEFCPDDFNAPGKKYIRLVEKEFNATFVCQQCTPTTAASHSGSGSPTNKMHIALVIIICAVVLAGLIFGGVVAFKYWQKKKRQQEQARFLKLFEQDDEVEDELGLGTII